MRTKLTGFFLFILLLILVGCNKDTTPGTVSGTMPPDITASTQATAQTAGTEATGEATEPVFATDPILATEPEELPEEDDLPLVRLTDHVSGVTEELAYSSIANRIGWQFYDFNDAYVRKGTAEKLVQASELLAQQGFGLKIWDAYRPVSAQKSMLTVDPNFHTDGDTYCQGDTVAVTLIDLATGTELAMPSGYGSTSELADRTYTDCPDTAQNVQLLEDVMKQCGFSLCPDHWWCYTDTVGYGVEESFDPVRLSQWTVRDGGDTTLYRDAQKTQTMGKLDEGDEVTLMGYVGSLALVEYDGIRGYVHAGSLLPIASALWAPICEENIGLLRYPNVGTDIGVIPVGATFPITEWDGKFGKAVYKGRTGYVMAQYVEPAASDFYASTVDVVTPTDVYTYDQMLEDLQQFQLLYPDQVTLDSIGSSEMGLDLPVLRIGNPEAEHHILFHAAIHGREHMTSWLLMSLVDYWLDHNLAAYGDVCYHIIPMVNPDGVAISQTATMTDDQMAMCRRDQAWGNTEFGTKEYARKWKANALGVDLNRNFDAAWEKSVRRSRPSGQEFRGETPFCASESIALRDYTLAYELDATISYHCSGSVIYWNFGYDCPVNPLSESLGNTISLITGYDMETAGSGGGYKDWAMDSLGIPSLTVEIGSGEAPLLLQEASGTLARNILVFPTIVEWIQNQQPAT